jgi:hypothetical protein
LGIIQKREMTYNESKITKNKIVTEPKDQNEKKAKKVKEI